VIESLVLADLLTSITNIGVTLIEGMIRRRLTSENPNRCQTLKAAEEQNAIQRLKP